MTLRSRTNRIAALATLGVFAATGVVFAVYKMVEEEIHRDGRETRVNVIMTVPNGSLQLLAGTRPGFVAKVQAESNDDDPPPLGIRYSYNPVGTTGTLRVALDEGMLDVNKPLADSWRANSGFSLARTNSIHSDFGDVSSEVSSFSRFTPSPTHDGGDHSKVFLTKEIPISLSAQLGFGESSIDLTGLSLTCLYIETGSAKTIIHLHEANPIPMSGCKISAGFGEFAMDGICNLNTNRFEFSGGVGYYSLGFDGKLKQNIDATIEVGLGKVAINIPPEAGRVRVLYDDSFFSSFAFSGLTERRKGYYTSIGFEQSNAPILTLHLSSGLGKMTVNYR